MGFSPAIGWLMGLSFCVMRSHLLGYSWNRV